MTVPTATSRTEYTGNGATVTFSTGFYFLAQSEVVVKVTDTSVEVPAEEVLVLGTDYTVTMPASVGANGSVVFTGYGIPDVTVDIVIERTVPYTQATSFRTQGSFSPAVHEDRFDEQVFIDQQLARRISDLESAGAAGSVVAGSGLFFSGSNLHVGAGNGIVVSSDSVAVNFEDDAAVITVATGDIVNRSAGVSNYAARADHMHYVHANRTPEGIAPGDAAVVGTSDALARGDHKHPVTAPSAPANVTKSTADAGVAVTFARGDHKHDISTASAGTITDSTNSEGSATSLARSDHGHSHGARGAGTLGSPLHSLAHAEGHGFMSMTKFNEVNTLVDGPANTSHILASRTTAQSIASGNEVFKYTTLVIDSLGLGEYDTTTGKFTAQNDGFYMVKSTINFDSASLNAASGLALSLVHNGATIVEVGPVDSTSIAETRQSAASLDCVIYMTAGDYIEIMVIQDICTLAITSMTGTSSPKLHIHRLY